MQPTINKKTAEKLARTADRTISELEKTHFVDTESFKQFMLLCNRQLISTFRAVDGEPATHEAFNDSPGVVYTVVLAESGNAALVAHCVEYDKGDMSKKIQKLMAEKHLSVLMAIPPMFITLTQRDCTLMDYIMEQLDDKK